MGKKKIILLIIAVVLVVGVIQIARVMLAPPKKAEVAEGPAPTRVLVAAQALAAGQLVQASQLRWDAIAEDESTENLVVEDVKKKVDYTGAVVRRGIRAGERVRQGQIVMPGERGFLAAVMNPGMRAVSVPITAVTGVAGFIFPGDRVDVILTHTVNRAGDPNMAGRKVSETVIENVRVLALDQKTNDQSTEVKVARIATLEVTPKQAEQMALLLEIGTLSLALRSLAENPQTGSAAPSAAPTLTAAGEDLAHRQLQARDDRTYTWDSDVSRVLPQPSSAVRNVEIIRGTEKTKQVFRGTEENPLTTEDNSP